MFATPIEIGTLNNNLYVATADLYHMTQPPKAEALLAEDSTNMNIFVTRRWDPVVDPNTPTSSIPTDLVAIEQDKLSDAKLTNFYGPQTNDLSNIKEFQSVHELTLDLLHKRFGHVDTNKIKQVLSNNAVNGLELSQSQIRHKHFCEHCIMAKSTKNSMHKDKSTALLPSKRIRHINRDLYFEVVHTDLIGPIQVESINKMRYGITFTEVKSRYRWFYALSSKSDALEAFQKFHAEITGHGFRIKFLKSDNGGEFTSHKFKSYCLNHQIIQRFTQPHTPQSNAYAERFNRILGERTRAMLLGGNLPLFLWDEAMETATYIYNRMIGPGHPRRTPFELIFGYKPDCSHLRAYGCLAFAYNFDVNRQKN
jgi:hypothetical protein